MALTLNHHEIGELREFLSLSYLNAESGSLAFTGEHGERLVFRYSNMGEPYREGVNIQVEGVDDFPDYLGPFVESSEARRLRDYITQ